MSIRSVMLGVGAAGAVLATAMLLGRRGADEPRPLGPSVPATATREPPPEFPADISERDRIEHWIYVVRASGDDDVAWAKAQLRLAGEPARQAVLAATAEVLESNVAFVEHALDILLATPQPDVVPLATEALASRDPQVVIRAAKLLGAVGPPHALAAAAKLADAARDRAHPVPQWAFDALSLLGPEGAREALRAARSIEEPAALASAYYALAGFRDDDVRQFLRERFESETSINAKFAAASALVAGGDTTPVEWLRELLDRFGSPALAVLAQARDPQALSEISRQMRSAIDVDRRSELVKMLKPYTLAEQRDALELAAGPDSPWEARVDALEALARLDAPGILDRIHQLLASDDRRDRHPAVLVVGRLRRPESAGPLLEALRRPDEDAEMRVFLLRGLVFVGDPESADDVVLAIAKDEADYFDPMGVAFSVVTVLTEAPAKFLEALGPEVIRALKGAHGPPRQSGLLHLVRATAVCCGSEAAPVVEPLLLHEDRHVREAAADVLATVGGPNTDRELRIAWWRLQDEYTRLAIRRTLERLHYRSGTRPR